MDERLPENAEHLGVILRRELSTIAEESDLISEVRSTTRNYVL